MAHVLRIFGQPTNDDDISEFDLVHDGNDVVVVSRHPLGNKELARTEVIRFKPNGRIIAAVRPGYFLNRDADNRFIIEGASEKGAL